MEAAELKNAPLPGGLPPLIFPHAGIRIIAESNISKLGVKRITGMTQGNGWQGEPSGSYFKATFRDGELRKLGEAALDAWTAADVNQDGIKATGYDTPTTGDDEKGFNAKEMEWPPGRPTRYVAPGAKYKVEFPLMHLPNAPGNAISLESQQEARKSSVLSTQLKEGGESRYTRETVEINLRNAALDFRVLI